MTVCSGRVTMRHVTLRLRHHYVKKLTDVSPFHMGGGDILGKILSYSKAFFGQRLTQVFNYAAVSLGTHGQRNLPICLVISVPYVDSIKSVIEQICMYDH
ncbi:hypothetical protein XELAEV_18007427mg [Xenopus laevis]|uniref:Uncharacterized protein n=1 Tax=Xenopus laevis TaxID=8355 RepID=A0A974E1W3_XENLA|nr:hypothetical protein XELAEV_18007427mg [Xenopus laevis]